MIFFPNIFPTFFSWLFWHQRIYNTTLKISPFLWWARGAVAAGIGFSRNWIVNIFQCKIYCDGQNWTPPHDWDPIGKKDVLGWELLNGKRFFNTFLHRIINLSWLFWLYNERWVCWCYLVVTQKILVVVIGDKVILTTFGFSELH